MDRLQKRFDTLAGEHLLAHRPNGGMVIAMRAVRTALALYLLGLLALALLKEFISWIPAMYRSLPTLALDNITWFGALLAIIYSSLQVRYGQQWTYLSSLYNQIKQVEIETAAQHCDAERNRLLAQWKAAFIEDAHVLHLFRKPAFAGIICAWEDAHDGAVRKAFVEHGPGADRERNQQLWRVITTAAHEAKNGRR